MGTLDPGLVVINGRVKDGIGLQDAEAEVNTVIDDFIKSGATEAEVEKVKNQAYSTLEFGEVEVMNRAMNLAFAKLSGDANYVNEETSLIEAVTADEVMAAARGVLREENSNVLYYKGQIR
jgi:zinc protease